MISTLTSFSVPPQIVTGTAAGGLLVILLIIYLFEDSAFSRKFINPLGLYSAPLLIFLGFSIISYVFTVVTS